MTSCSVESYSIHGVTLGAENPFPIFRDPNPHKPVLFDRSLPPQHQEKMGWQAAQRVLPYRMQDQYQRNRQPLQFQAVILENQILRATFLPEMGGRLVSLFHKPEEKELLSKNPVFQPANFAIRNAWFSGGIEWNIGHFGHAFSTCSPLFGALIKGRDGEPAFRIYEFERCKQVYWQIDFYLPEDSPYLITYTRIINPREASVPMYWWTNIAVPETDTVRVLAPCTETIYVDFSQKDQRYGLADLPFLPSAHGKDASYPANFDFASEYFFQAETTNRPWQAALDEDGSGLIEFSTPPLRYRKMFCWGMHPGGRRWQDFLSTPGTAYLEIQAGLTPTQLHGLEMPGNTTWDWVQAFGLFQGDPQQIHQDNYAQAIQYVSQALHTLIPPNTVTDWQHHYRQLATQTPSKILHHGSGWGALEAYRLQAQENGQPPSGFVFPAQGLNAEQQKWIELLDQQLFPEPNPTDLPGEWLIQEEWLSLLENLPQKNWFSLLHEGVMRMENGDSAAAVARWQQSINLQPSVWAYRNLAVAAQRNQQPNLALSYYRIAWTLLKGQETMPVSFLVEFLRTLLDHNLFAEAKQVYDTIPENLREHDRIQILLGRISLRLKDYAALEEVLSREYADIREGETELTDLWYAMWMERIAQAEHKQMDDALRVEIEERFPPPKHIDFRMY